MYRWVLACIAVTLVALLLVAPASAAGVPFPVTDTTITFQSSGAIHIKAVQTVADDKDGVTDYHFDLQKMYDPDYVFVYDYDTGQPLRYDTKESGDVIGYTVQFDRPYYNGYKFVVEYDCHRRIIYEGSGVYSFSMRTAIDSRHIDRTFTVILPTRNFTYLGYNTALDHPVSETQAGASLTIVFHNVTNAGDDYAWEVRFGATGIDAEVRKLDAPNYKLPVPGMSFSAAIAALVIFVMSRKR
jgi:hypothetical protein